MKTILKNPSIFSEKGEKLTFIRSRKKFLVKSFEVLGTRTIIVSGTVSSTMYMVSSGYTSAANGTFSSSSYHDQSGNSSRQQSHIQMNSNFGRRRPQKNRKWWW